MYELLSKQSKSVLDSQEQDELNTLVDLDNNSHEEYDEEEDDDVE
jgi:hypothetical protein